MNIEYSCVKCYKDLKMPVLQKTKRAPVFHGGMRVPRAQNWEWKSDLGLVDSKDRTI